MTRAILRFAAAAAALLTAAGTASAQEEWMVSEYDDPAAGGRVGSIIYGVPQTDDITVVGRCFAAAGGQIELTLYVDASGFNPGVEAPVSFRAPGSAELTRTAAIVDSEMFGPHPVLNLSRSDALIGLLAAARSVDVAVFNNPARTIQLRGSSAAISQFNAICASIDAQAPGPGAVPQASSGVPLPGPLFLVPSQPMPVYANFDGNGRLPAFPPSTELMGLNTTGSFNGQELLQVATLRGAGVTGWVPRSMLVPTSGGASEYQNLNQAANLVLRSGPSSTADSVGTVPPQARGIFDLGQRSGAYVYVRYGNLTGWASHDYLAPILQPAAGAAPSGNAGKGPGAADPVPVDDPGKPVVGGAAPVGGAGVGDPGKPVVGGAAPVGGAGVGDPGKPVEPVGGGAAAGGVDAGKPGQPAGGGAAGAGGDAGKPVAPVALPDPGDPGKPVVDVPPVVPEKVPGGVDVGGAGPSGSAFAGSWRFAAEKGCPGCTLTVADTGGLLLMTSSEGWQVELILGADGDPTYATGEGLWMRGPLSGQGVTVDAFLEGPQLWIIRSIPAGTVQQYYARF